MVKNERYSKQYKSFLVQKTFNSSFYMSFVIANAQNLIVKQNCVKQ